MSKITKDVAAWIKSKSRLRTDNAPAEADWCSQAGKNLHYSYYKHKGQNDTQNFTEYLFQKSNWLNISVRGLVQKDILLAYIYWKT